MSRIALGSIGVRIIIIINSNRNIQPISRRTIVRDMVLLFNAGREILISRLAKHIDTGRCLCITIDTWSACNYKSFTAVTRHWIDSDWKHNSELLDIIKLTDLVHSGKYLAEKLSEITDSLGITSAIFTVTQDNAISNNSMLDEFESIAEEYKQSKPESVQQPWSFTWKEGDICYLRHVINLAVRDALKQLKATLSDILEEYWIRQDKAQLLYSHCQNEIVLALSKL